MAGNEEKILIYAELSQFYSLRNKYSKMLDEAAEAIFLADKAKLHFYAAANYVSLADNFMQLYDYDTAESLLERALAYEIPPEGIGR